MARITDVIMFRKKYAALKEMYYANDLCIQQVRKKCDYTDSGTAIMCEEWEELGIITTKRGSRRRKQMNLTDKAREIFPLMEKIYNILEATKYGKPAN